MGYLNRWRHPPQHHDHDPHCTDPYRLEDYLLLMIFSLEQGALSLGWISTRSHAHDRYRRCVTTAMTLREQRTAARWHGLAPTLSIICWLDLSCHPRRVKTFLHMGEEARAVAVYRSVDRCRCSHSAHTHASTLFAP
jgi:hypothetical protein